MAFSSTTLAHLTAAIACHSNSDCPPNPSSYPSQISPNLMRFGFRSSFAFSRVLVTRSTGQAVSALQQSDSFSCSDKYDEKYVPQTLIMALSELESAFKALPTDHEFQKELDGILRGYVCRETPLYFAPRLTEHYRRPNGEGPEIYFKREDFNPPCFHKMKNAVAQALLAKRLGKKRIIAEVGATEVGVATANVCETYGLQCTLYVAAQDMERLANGLNRMKRCGADVRRVDSNVTSEEASIDWVTNVETSHYIIGSEAGPHPYPMMVREFHSLIGKETRKLAMEKWGGKPDVLISFVGGESNAMGLFNEFLQEKDVRLIGVEAAGFLLGNVHNVRRLPKQEVPWIIERLGISGVGPEHKSLKDSGRAEFYKIYDKEALEAYFRLIPLEGLKPSLEASHALAYLEKLCPTLANGTKVVLNFNARGEKELLLL